MDRLQNIETFVRVAQTRSFAEAARQLRLSKSVVTTRVKQLEEYVGGALFHRSTRVVRLSELGVLFLHDCSELVGEANRIVDQMRDVHGSPTGTLKVHALPGFVLGHLAGVLRAFQQKYPGIALDLMVSDAAVDPVKEGVDCALQIFPTLSTELISLKLFSVRRVFCASKQYCDSHEIPESPADLLKHPLGLYSKYPTRDRWAFYHSSGTQSVDLRASLLTNSVHLLKEYGLEGAGIVCIPTLVAADAILSGELKIILPDWQLSSFDLSIVYPQTLRGAFKLRLFIDTLVNSFPAAHTPWDEALCKAGLLPADLVLQKVR